jgi:hypothetical protein
MQSDGQGIEQVGHDRLIHSPDLDFQSRVGWFLRQQHRTQAERHHHRACANSILLQRHLNLVAMRSQRALNQWQ